MLPMPRSPAPADHTPQSRLTEGCIHPIVGYQLAQAAVATTQVFMRRVGRPLKLRPVEFTILALVRDNPDATARQIARALAVTPPNIALWLDKLESRGFIARTRSERDARMQHIRATAAGAALVLKAAAQLVEGERAELSALTAVEQAMLVELLHKIALGRRTVATG
jgi:DNA-binding MarR family transcriptional regulator